MEDELMKKMKQWVEDGFSLYLDITDATDDEVVLASLQAIKLYANALDEDQKFMFKAEVLGNFLSGLKEGVKKFR